MTGKDMIIFIGSMFLLFLIIILLLKIVYHTVYNATDEAIITVITAIISCKEIIDKKSILDDIRLTLMDAVWDVIEKKTLEQVLADEETFRKIVQESFGDTMNNMGLKLVSLNIQIITESNKFFDDIAFPIQIILYTE